MIIRRGKKRAIGLNEPLRHQDHRRPVTRRDFLAQGFITGSATIIAPTMLGVLANSKAAHALSADINALKTDPLLCNIQAGAGKVPFICFDLAGGANIAGSNALVGGQGGQMDFLTTAGYSKLGIPGNMVPNASVTGTFIDTSLGIAFHSDSAFLRGITSKISATTAANINGIVIPARSENDTQNNPHNPMYGIARAGARGELLTLIGSQSSDSGGNSMAPLAMMTPELRPTKIDRTSDTVGLVDTGQLSTLFPNTSDTVSVMESMSRISTFKLGKEIPAPTTAPVDTLLGAGDSTAKKNVQCSYVKTADLAERYSDPAVLNPSIDPLIRGATGIFTDAEFTGDREFEKTAAVMKLTVNGYAGAATISMGGFDYHTGDRMTGEGRDFRAGQCMGACLEYAARRGRPLMLYVFSDGSLNSNGAVDNSVGGRGKGQWTGDNQSTAASLILVYSPTGRPALAVPGRNQLGWFRGSGDIDTASSPAANAVNLLVETVILNYMALHGEEGNFQTLFPNTGLSTAQISSLIGISRIL